MPASAPSTSSNWHGLLIALETHLRDAWVAAGYEADALGFPNVPALPPDDPEAAPAPPVDPDAPPALPWSGEGPRPDTTVWGRVTILGGEGAPATAGRPGDGTNAHDEAVLVVMLQLFAPAGLGAGAIRRAADPMRACLRRAVFTAPDASARVTEATVTGLSGLRLADPPPDGQGAGWAQGTFSATLSVLEPV